MIFIWAAFALFGALALVIFAVVMVWETLKLLFQLFAEPKTMNTVEGNGWCRELQREIAAERQQNL